MNHNERSLVTDIKVNRVLDAMRDLNDWVSAGARPTGWQMHDLEMAFKRIAYKVEELA